MKNLHLTDQQIIEQAKFISVSAFLASNQLKARTDLVKSILADGYNVSIVYWNDGAKAYIPLSPNQTAPSNQILIKAYREFHSVLSKKPNIKGRVWVQF